MNRINTFLFIITLSLPVLPFNPDSLRLALPPLTGGISFSDSNLQVYLSTYGLDTLGGLSAIGRFRRFNWCVRVKAARLLRRDGNLEK